MTATQISLESYRDHFAAVADRSPQSLRRQALDRFCELGFPTMRHEDWRFTNVAPIAGTEFRPAAPVELTEADLGQ